MWDFAYQAKNDRGELQSGRLSADDVSAAVHALASQGLEVVSIRRVDVEIEPSVSEPNTAEHSAAEHPTHNPALELLTSVIERRHLWLPVIESQLQELPTGPARRATEARINRFSQSMTVEQFLQNTDGVELLLLLNSDEIPTPASQHMQAWLHRIYQDQHRRLQRGSRWSYPLLLAAIGLALAIGWSTLVLPIFREMFDEFGLNLPPPTRLLFWVSDQVTTYALRTLLVVAVGCAMVIAFMRWWRSRALTNRIFGRFVAGTTENLRAMSRLTGTLAELLGLQLPLASALSFAGQASGHRYFADAAARAAESASVNMAGNAGLNMTEVGAPVDPTGRLPQSVVYGLTAGNAGQPNVAVLRELAMIYGQIAQSRQERSLGNLPVVGVLILGLVVGFVVIALFLPLFSMITSLA
jgi:type IV pilus assembly protein PilC